tara:strand:+ start:266 stop:493 length:228 start_codon:yes stop_codon:yes gene_type:complete
MKVIVHNLGKIKEEKKINVNNKLENLINEIIDYNLELEIEIQENKETKSFLNTEIEDIVDMKKVAEEFKNNILSN